MPVLLATNLIVGEVADSNACNRLPTRRAATAQGGPGQETPVDTAGKLLRVLIVESDRPTADTLCSRIDSWGYDVRRANDGVFGLALALSFRPDVMLLDMATPDTSGLEVVVQVRQRVHLKHCFIIAVTRRTDKKHRCQCYEAGIDLCLTKPVIPSHLQTLLMLESKYVRCRDKMPTDYDEFNQ
jgi:CheY-like chemotaxis protein